MKAYTQFGVDANSLVKLDSGKVVDVAGNGDFAIGRWTDGSSSVGSTNSNQGTPYVVGKPLKVLQVLGIGQIRNCTLLASTRPTAVSGNFRARQGEFSNCGHCPEWPNAAVLQH